jgi:hypothetical protein
MGKIITITKNAFDLEDLEETIKQYQTMGFKFNSIIPYKFTAVFGTVKLYYVLIIFEK